MSRRLRQKNQAEIDAIGDNGHFRMIDELDATSLDEGLMTHNVKEVIDQLKDAMPNHEFLSRETSCVQAMVDRYTSLMAFQEIAHVLTTPMRRSHVLKTHHLGLMLWQRHHRVHMVYGLQAT